MDLPPVAVRTAYWLARELSPQAIAFTRNIALDEIDHPTVEQYEYARTKYDLALRIAQQPVQGPLAPWEPTDEDIEAAWPMREGY